MGRTDRRDHRRLAGAIRGRLIFSATSSRAIEGWAQNLFYPESPVCLDIYADGRLIGQTMANLHRDDLETAGIGSGHHAFVFTPPEGAVVWSAAIEVRRSLDGARLARGDDADVRSIRSSGRQAEGLR
jgi:hypothetical protein